MESSTDRICEFDENQEPNRNLNAAIRSFIDDRTAKRSSVKDSSVSMGSHHRSNSSIKENIRYSQVDEDKENSTLSKILDHVELKYITNNSERRKERQQYEEDVDECKMLIDFQNTSHLKETPNISSSSNMKSYGKYDSESQKPTGKKFIRHTRRSSYQDPEEVIPVKEVNIFDIHANFDDRITNLRSFYEPENQDPDKVVLEWQNIHLKIH